VGGGLLDWTEREHPTQVDAIRAEIDGFFAALPERKPAAQDEFIAELRSALPHRAAERAIEIYRGHAVKIRQPPG